MSTLATEGFVRFKSQPGVKFRYKLAYGPKEPTIWVENHKTKEQWQCFVDDFADCGPKGVTLPPDAIMDCVAAAFAGKDYDEAQNDDQTLDLVPSTDNQLQLKVPFVLQMGKAAWKPLYVFQMKHMELAEIDKLKSKVRDLEDACGRPAFINLQMATQVPSGSFVTWKTHQQVGGMTSEFHVEGSAVSVRFAGAYQVSVALEHYNQDFNGIGAFRFKRNDQVLHTVNYRTAHKNDPITSSMQLIVPLTPEDTVSVEFIGRGTASNGSMSLVKLGVL